MRMNRREVLELGATLALLPVAGYVAVEAKPILYRCRGCREETHDPEAQLLELYRQGYFSCCPDRLLLPCE